LDPNDAYVIGGIVDRNRYINLTLDKANKDGVRHGKLPIGDYVRLQTSAVLAVNHVVEIMAT
jgi:tRNA (guanine9-N1)-methyltransferase